MSKIVFTTKDNKTYCVDTDNKTIQGGEFTEPTKYLGGTYMCGDKGVFQLENRRLFATSTEIVKYNSVLQNELPPKNPENIVLLATKSGSLYTVNEKEKTIEGGKLSEPIKFTSWEDKPIGEKGVFHTEDNRKLVTTAVDTRIEIIKEEMADLGSSYISAKLPNGKECKIDIVNKTFEGFGVLEAKYDTCTIGSDKVLDVILEDGRYFSSVMPIEKIGNAISNLALDETPVLDDTEFGL